VIGARGSGKAALGEMVAAGCDAYQHSERPSFLPRAAEHPAGAAVTLTCKAGDPPQPARLMRLSTTGLDTR
jgi:hypothetical protein